MNEKRAVQRRRSGAMWRQIAAATRHSSLFYRFFRVKCRKRIIGVFDCVSMLISLKEIPHNMDGSLASDFQPSAACKFLDLLAGNQDFCRQQAAEITRLWAASIARHFLNLPASYVNHTRRGEWPRVDQVRIMLYSETLREEGRRELNLPAKYGSIYSG